MAGVSQLCNRDSLSFAAASVSPMIGITPGRTAIASGARPYLPSRPFKLRQYKVLPGKMDEWVKIMEEEIIPFQVSKGMVITGSYRGETDDSCYVWMRRFESEAEREALYKAVYDSDFWKTKIAPRVPACLDRTAMVVTRIVPTPKSTTQ